MQQLTGEDLFEFQASVLFLPKDQEPPGAGQRSHSEQRSRLQAADESLHALSHAQRTTRGTSRSHAADDPDLIPGDVEEGAYPSEFYDAILEDAIGHTSFQHLLAPEDFHRMNDYVELADAENAELDEDDLYPDLERAQALAARDPVPPPKRLVVERQLHKSLLLSWYVSLMHLLIVCD
jgi:hypothetical protein